MLWQDDTKFVIWSSICQGDAGIVFPTRAGSDPLHHDETFSKPASSDGLNSLDTCAESWSPALEDHLLHPHHCLQALTSLHGNAYFFSVNIEVRSAKWWEAERPKNFSSRGSEESAMLSHPELDWFKILESVRRIVKQFLLASSFFRQATSSSSKSTP